MSPCKRDGIVAAQPTSFRVGRRRKKSKERQAATSCVAAGFAVGRKCYVFFVARVRGWARGFGVSLRTSLTQGRRTLADGHSVQKRAAGRWYKIANCESAEQRKPRYRDKITDKTASMKRRDAPRTN